ncbi:hypothetical protein H7849_23005 [Alloacidobacterium dinghuense]|uniref:Uncharacterized protein n=1 Tax=Alloacidobacterium dinghuense TaxID=2763107 RepID=A0A7G8BH46_9BACT|nr:hypothetical protein [Alloacidobacterium dinghuense]QNI31866.1 hypothetical protein H7849_23005 [Alloacidobacterium dinghuense]
MPETYEFAPQAPQSITTQSGRDPEVFLSNSSNKAETVMETTPALLDVRYSVAFRIGNSIPEVQALFTHLEGKSLRVWTVVADRDESVYRKIYAQEKELIHVFDGMEFEFNIIPSLGRNAKEIISDPGSKLVFAR